MAEPGDEFAEIVAPLEEHESEASQLDQIRMYLMEDPDFRAAVVERMAELTGMKIGKELLSDE